MKKCKIVKSKMAEFPGVKGYSLKCGKHYPQIDHGVKNWFPTKKEAVKYKKEYEKESKSDSGLNIPKETIMWS